MEPLRRAFRGYDPAQVDRRIAELTAQLEQTCSQVEKLAAENAELHASLEQFRSEEGALKEILVGAHRQSEEILADARKEAETLLQVAREAGARMQEDLRGRISDLNWQIERLSLQRQKFHSDFRGLLEGYLAQLSEPEQPRLQLSEVHEPATTEIEAAT